MSEKQKVSYLLKAKYLKVLLMGDTNLILQELQRLYDKDLESIDIFINTVNEELMNFTEENPNTLLHIRKVEDSDFEKVHIAYILTEDATDRISAIQQAKKHKIIIVDEVSKEENTDIKEKLILNKLNNFFPTDFVLII